MDRLFALGANNSLVHEKLAAYDGNAFLPVCFMES